MVRRTNAPDGPTFDRYRVIEYGGDDGPVTIIQDATDPDAWIQSDTVSEVRP